LARHEPSLRRPLAGALRVLKDSVVYPPAAALAFLDAASRDGATVLSGWRVQRIESGAVTGEKGTLGADVIVNAAGNNSGTLSADAPLRPRRGHLVITERYPGMVKHQIVELGYLKSAHGFSGQSVAFNVQPRATGQMLIGSSRELGASDRQINPEVLSLMLARAEHFMPAIGKFVATRVWTGLRPTSADKLPFIGPSVISDNVWIATGHEGLGITTSLATGKLIAAMVTGSPPAIDVAPFRPGRASAEWN
jgi:glycine/D-amino acid oxidase-like deaminating enzyme